ncbi:TMEM175 family protein [Arcticibacter sp. MXS-1]|uniref:TMEM175 family protein n=1 Tax=Arcticibacter sp. MXS-1 TaxID=3341726 RepID=UPI0035A954D3
MERLIFFSDAIVAIAITLLALALKIDAASERHITFADLLRPWKTYLAFILSFVNIAGFWQRHHTIFCYIRKIDQRMLVLNLGWLFFIVVLPFTTSILSLHFSDTPAIFLYASNVFMLSLMQKLIWGYGADELTDALDTERAKHIDLMFSLDMLNGIVAIIVSFFYPTAAFILLFFKIPLFVVASLYFAAERRKKYIK